RARTRDSWRTGCPQESSNSAPSALIERRGNDAGPSFLAADQNCELTAGRRSLQRKIREADRFFQCRRVRPAGHDADFLVAVNDRVAVASDAAIDHFESHQLASWSFGALSLEHVATEEVALLQFHNPSQVGLERSRGVVNIVSVERH